MADLIKPAGNVCLRPGSGKQYSLQRAVVQLGRTLEWGAYPDDFLTLSQLTLTCSTLGKSARRRDLTLSQNMLKFIHEWIKKVDKEMWG